MPRTDSVTCEEPTHLFTSAIADSCKEMLEKGRGLGESIDMVALQRGIGLDLSGPVHRFGPDRPEKKSMTVRSGPVHEIAGRCTCVAL